MNFKRKFTLWYIRRGYTFDYVFDYVCPDDDRVILPRAVFECPWWVKPLLILFSPSIYSHEVWLKHYAETLIKALKMEEV